MTEAKHTPGPWEVVDDGPHQPLRIHFTDVDADEDGRARDYGHDICYMADAVNDDADAALIAAAPNLYEALAWIAQYTHENGTKERALAALRLVSPQERQS